MKPSTAVSIKQCFDRGLTALRDGDNREACQWLERVTRLCPEDETAVLALAAAQQRINSGRASATLANLVQSNPECMEGWFALAAAHASNNDINLAADTFGQLLKRFSAVADGNFNLLADKIVEATDWSGWIDVDAEGIMTASLSAAKSTPPDVVVDGKPVPWRSLPGAGPALRSRLPLWARRGRMLNASTRGKPLLGSGLDLRRRFGVQGIVDWQSGDRIVVWGWVPACPGTPPRLAVTVDEGQPIRLRGAVAGRVSPHLLSYARRAWRFTLPLSLAGAARLAIRAPDGRDLWGSPLLGGTTSQTNQQVALRIASATNATPMPAALFDPWQPLPVEERAPQRANLASSSSEGLRCCVVIPVHDQLEDTRRCLQSVLAALPVWGQVIVIDDGSTEPGVANYIAGLARVRVIRNAAPLGFPKAANIGLRAAMASGPCDTVLLNSDTVVAVGWLNKLRRAAYASADVGSVTPLSCDGSIVSHPVPSQLGDFSAAGVVTATDAELERLNDSKLIDLPSGVGFCLYMTAACLAETGLLREDIFAQGYGEENDWCMRARALGWRHVAALDIFVSHLGGRTFGLGRDYLTRRNSTVLERLHPGYRAYVAAHPYQAILRQTWRRFQAAQFRARATAGRSVLLVTHRLGGGVERFVQWRIEAFAAAGMRVILLKSASPEDAPGLELCRLSEGAAMTSGMEYSLPEDVEELVELLRACSIRSIEIHHTLGYGQFLAGLVESLTIPAYIYIHDYANWCPRLHLTSYNDAYCGEPEQAEICDACVRDLGAAVEGVTSVSDYRRQNADLLRKASGCYVPSMDVKLRLDRQFPGIRTTIVPWEGAVSARKRPKTPTPAAGPFKIVVMGAIGLEKGYRTLLACARDAGRRDLPLNFHVVGFTIDDERLMETGRVFVSGRYRQDEAADLLEEASAELGFVPSVCPETWCFTLSELLTTGLPVVTFDIGTQAERTRQSKNGLVLPQTLSPHAINDAMLHHIQRHAAHAARPTHEDMQ